MTAQPVQQRAAVHALIMAVSVVGNTATARALSHRAYREGTEDENPVHLIASHCKPWRDSTNEERLDGENGLLLTPSIDHLFDRGFIGFENDGNLIISPVAHRPSLQRLGIDTMRVVNVGGFTSGQKQFLDFHRDAVLLQSVRA